MNRFSVIYVTEESSPFPITNDFLSGAKAKDILLSLIERNDVLSIRIKEGEDIVFATASYEDIHEKLINDNTIDKLGFLI